MRALMILALAISAASADVTLLRIPDGGIQPQAVVDKSGRIHLVYFKGAPRAGDLFYVTKSTNDLDFSKPLRVNSRASNAIAVGTIRGAQIALGKGNRLHVAWNSADGKEMLYTRLNNGAFEPERNVMTWTGGLDGGGSVAANENGDVYVTWHGSAPDNKRGEAGRAVFVAESTDEGKTFRKEWCMGGQSELGACGCCGMKALAPGDDLYVLYRAATKVTNRDMILMVSSQPWSIVSKWTVASCPMSSAALINGREAVIAAWEKEGEVAFTDGPHVVTPLGKGKRKHPSLAQNGSGTILLAWVENTGWEKGGTLAWQLFKPSSGPIGDIQRKDGIPVWSMAAAVAVGEKFYIIY